MMYILGFITGAIPALGVVKLWGDDDTLVGLILLVLGAICMLTPFALESTGG